MIETNTKPAKFAHPEPHREGQGFAWSSLATSLGSFLSPMDTFDALAEENPTQSRPPIIPEVKNGV